MRRALPVLCLVAAALARKGSLSDGEHDRYRREWTRARRAVRRLRGSARWNFAGVIANTRSLARRRLLGARLAPAFLTLERNYEWFWTERRPSARYGARTTFGDSPLIFQFYPRSGWQIQPLGSFGRLNGLARSKRTSDATLSAFADALLAVAVERKGFLAVEYYFPWAGGAPGWVSGMAAATGAAAFARVWHRTGDARYRDAAERMLGVFFARPPWGVRVDRGGGRRHYLLYSQTPRVLIGNGFAQSLIGLSDVERITGSRRAGVALEHGLAQADVGMRRYDTGYWSLYWRRPGSRSGRESDLHYHQLFKGFLTTLCRRFPERSFCGVRDRFARYEQEPVRIGRLHVRRHRRTMRVRVWVSKPGSGVVRLMRGGRAVRRASVGLGRGSRVIAWRVPRRAGRYLLRIDAVSLTGVTSARTRTVVVR
jgi:hypothetical protein